MLRLLVYPVLLLKHGLNFEKHIIFGFHLNTNEILILMIVNCIQCIIFMYTNIYNLLDFYACVTQLKHAL